MTSQNTENTPVFDFNAHAVRKRQFLPPDIDLLNWSVVEPYFRNLLNRKLNCAADCENLIRECDEIETAIMEVESRLFVASTQNTEDEEIRRKKETFQKEVKAKSIRLITQIQKKYLESPFRFELDASQFAHYDRIILRESTLFREDSLTLQLEEESLQNAYMAAIGGLEVPFKGKNYTLSQMKVFDRDSDRKLRKSAFLASMEKLAEISEEIDEIFDEMIRIRHRIARQAGFANYRDYKHYALDRMAYSTHDCLLFHDSMRKFAVPLSKKLDRRKQKLLEVETFRPWDQAVDPLSRPSLKPFDSTEEMVEGTARLFDTLFPSAGNLIRNMHRGGNLDLESRKGKAMAGYNTVFAEEGTSFIFMHAVGLFSDTSILIHEGGHAIEKHLCHSQPLLRYRHGPSEWAELASQAHELLVLDHLEEIFPDEEQRKQCLIDAIDKLISFFPRVALIDHFQHWIYTHPDHSHEERRSKWAELAAIYGGGVDWRGYEEYRRLNWQLIAHFFIVPFYYIEYGISQLAAIQLWQKVRQEGRPAIERFYRALSQGFSKPLEELYKGAGLRFEMHGPIVANTMAFLDSMYDKYSDTN